MLILRVAACPRLMPRILDRTGAYDHAVQLSRRHADVILGFYSSYSSAHNEVTYPDAPEINWAESTLLRFEGTCKVITANVNIKCVLL
jgi:hypothetical protein